MFARFAETLQRMRNMSGGHLNQDLTIIFSPIRYAIGCWLTWIPSLAGHEGEHNSLFHCFQDHLECKD